MTMFCVADSDADGGELMLDLPLSDSAIDHSTEPIAQWWLYRFKLLTVTGTPS